MASDNGKVSPTRFPRLQGLRTLPSILVLDLVLGRDSASHPRMPCSLKTEKLVGDD
jgi:hypothetical protein